MTGAPTENRFRIGLERQFTSPLEILFWQLGKWTTSKSPCRLAAQTSYSITTLEVESYSAGPTRFDMNALKTTKAMLFCNPNLKAAVCL